MHKLILAALCALLLPLPAHAARSDAEAVARAETYMNTLHSMAAKFIQTTDGGQTVTGSMLISRPGRMNLSYDPPMKDFIIADGSFVYMWDGELEQSTTLPLGGSLADLILRDPVKLSGDVKVTDVDRGASKLEISVVEADNADNGTMTLLFEDNPFILRGWRVQDSQNRTTQVMLQNLRENIDIPPRSFTFVSPKFGRGKGDKVIND